MDLVCKKHIDLLFYRDGNIIFMKQCPLKFISGNKWWSTKVGAKFLSDLVMFLILSPDIPLDFSDSTRDVLVKHLTYFSYARKV